MTDFELVQYYLPHSLLHWPEEWPKMARTIKRKLKTEAGQKELRQLREEYEYNWIQGHRYDREEEQNDRGTFLRR